jgi:hypothetical protein
VHRPWEDRVGHTSNDHNNNPSAGMAKDFETYTGTIGIIGRHRDANNNTNDNNRNDLDNNHNDLDNNRNSHRDLLATATRNGKNAFVKSNDNWPREAKESGHAVGTETRCRSGPSAG